LAFCIAAASSIHHQRGEWTAAQQQAEASIALCKEQGFASFQAQAKIYLGQALTTQGQGEEGVALIEQGLDAARATGAVLFRTWFLSKLAEACRTTRRCEEGLTAIAEAIAIMEKIGERFFEAELYRLRGELLIMQDASNTFQADRSFRDGIEVARRQSAKSLELRATTSLTRLTATQGRRDEARAMLAAIYGWFTEGFDTKDLQDAKALLDELS
jgi:predicted ATPase